MILYNSSEEGGRGITVGLRDQQKKKVIGKGLTQEETLI